mmetsp:Transcript_7708/g.11606  ORF Transcript_7708/g.11606 Transcript_7708/m.11606 type:complete len:228 (-) Transcript_7708:18-701(-)
MFFPSPFTLITLIVASECFRPKYAPTRGFFTIPLASAKSSDSPSDKSNIEKSNISEGMARLEPIGRFRRRNPMRAFYDIFDTFEKEMLEDEMTFGSPFTQDLSSFFRRPLAPCKTPLMGHLDISETDTDMKVSIDLPGVRKEDIHLNLENNYLTISAEKNEEYKEEDRNFRLQERNFGHVKRVVHLPNNVSTESSNVKAAFKDGVLHVDFQKVPELKEPPKSEIEIQ